MKNIQGSCGVIMGIDGVTRYGMYVDENGEPIERTPLTHPYNYESFVTWQKKGTSKKDLNGAVYSDRLYQWDAKKHNELCQKHFGNEGQYWNEREPEKIEAFLRDYWEKPETELLMIMQGCNQSSGYPLWIFFYRMSEGKV